MVQRATIEVYTPFQQVREFCRFAKKYSSDYNQKPLSKYLDADLYDVWKTVQDKYLLEQGEQILRPFYFFQVGGDCDDQCIALTSLFLAVGCSPHNIFICEAKERASDEHYCHIFCAIADPKGGVIWLDALPESKYNQLDYPESCLKITRMSDYL
jgi:hypothetical protein